MGSSCPDPTIIKTDWGTPYTLFLILNNPVFLAQLICRCSDGFGESCPRRRRTKTNSRLLLIAAICLFALCFLCRHFMVNTIGNIIENGGGGGVLLI
jgi:hypothetical protein